MLDVRRGRSASPLETVFNTDQTRIRPTPEMMRMNSTDNARRVLDDRLHLGVGFKEHERTEVLEILSALATHLAHWDPSDIEIDVSVHDRGGKEQRVTLRALLPDFPPLVAVANDRDLRHALSEAKRDLIRQIDRHKSEREPKENRLLRRETIRRPVARRDRA
jgi:ribosome-associated translation inhibitor RaiA